MAAPADGPVLGRRAGHAPPASERSGERGFGQAIGWRQHAATVRTAWHPGPSNNRQNATVGGAAVIKGRRPGGARVTGGALGAKCFLAGFVCESLPASTEASYGAVIRPA